MTGMSQQLLAHAKQRIAGATAGNRTRTIHLMMFRLAHTSVRELDAAEVVARLDIQASYMTEWQKMLNLVHDLILGELGVSQ